MGEIKIYQLNETTWAVPLGNPEDWEIWSESYFALKRLVERHHGYLDIDSVQSEEDLVAIFFVEEYAKDFAKEYEEKVKEGW